MEIKNLLKVSFYILLCLFVLPAFSQERSITGNVTESSNGLPLPGVTITVKGTTTKTSTNNVGAFRLNTNETVVSLIASAVGYKNQTVVVTGNGVVNIKLTSSDNNLKEVVVVSVGYGTLNKKEVSSAITHVSSKDLLSVASNNPLMSLQGKVAGLSITNTSTADPNSSPSIQLRGVSSRSAGLGPLFVINNVPGGNIDNINQNDIESIDVLKGGAASAIYGTRGSNGVIIITTKKGTAQSNMTYNGYTSFDYLTNPLKNLSAADFRTNRINNKLAQDYGGETDWLKSVTRSPAISHKHTLQLSGGSGKTNFLASADYRNADGIDLRAHKTEYGARINVNHTTADDVFSASLTVAPRIMSTSGSDGGNFNNALTLNPTYQIYNPSGQYNYINTGFFSNNPVENARLIQAQSQIKELDINGSFKANILANLSTTVTISEIIRSAKNLNFSPSTLSSLVHANAVNKTNYASQEQEDNDQKNIEWIGNYSLNLNKNHFKLLGGYSYSYYNYQRFNANNYDFPFDSYLWNNLNSGLYNGGAAGQGQGAVGSTQNDSKLIAFFGRLNYDFDGKYIVTASLRHEGSSKFGTNNKWGNFPAVSAAWRIIEEDFLKDKFSWLNDLKLRADYGITGNQDFGSYQSLLLYGSAGYFPFNGTQYQVYGPSSNINPFLSWEKAINFNAGIDLALFDNRLTASLDYYVKKDKDLLGNYNVPLPPNTQSQTFTNVGEMKNTGFEVALNGAVVRGDKFSYNVSLAASYNKNKFISFSNDLYKGSPFQDQAGLPGPGSPGSIQRIQEGQSIGDFYTLKSAGVDPTGALLVYRKDGSTVAANLANNDDKQFLGNGLPKVMASLGNTFKYMNWDLSIFLRGAFNYKIFNTYAFYLGTPSTQADANVLSSAFDPKSKYSKLTNSSTTSIASDYFLENGSFLKIDNITLAYSHPIKSKYLHAIRLYGTGRNLHTFTKYTGGDPDLVPINGLAPGVNTSLNYYPSTVQVLFGLQATF
jgi:TonB-linked SusC/RagA family outer membrane protein